MPQHLPSSVHRFLRFSSWLLFIATLFLIVIGGMVTSTGSGLTVPDWPTSYGYNMFLFPYERWVGGIWIEHVHRLWASGVGLLTVINAIIVSLTPASRRLQWMSWIAVVLVITQGLLGGFRVILVNNHLGWIHACAAQVFLILCLAIALKLNRIGLPSIRFIPQDETAKISWQRSNSIAKLILALIFAQLIIGAAMRHEHAGLAVPDFPTAYGTLWPMVNHERLASINQERAERNWPPTSIAQIHLHMMHRALAVVIALMILFRVRNALKSAPDDRKIIPFWPALNKTFAALLIIQFMLGAMTVWSGKAALIATLHVVTGALLFSLAFIFVWLSHAVLQSIALPSHS
jgi:cytochrome c oxidase assembly protein subunit 15